MFLSLIKGGAKTSIDESTKLLKMKEITQKVRDLESFATVIQKEATKIEWDELTEALKTLKMNCITILKISKETCKQTDLKILNKARKDRSCEYLKVIDSNDDLISE